MSYTQIPLDALPYHSIPIIFVLIGDEKEPENLKVKLKHKFKKKQGGKYNLSIEKKVIALKHSFFYSQFLIHVNSVIFFPKFF
jgi:hypothetical protein